MDSRWSEDDLLANYGYDTDTLLREVYGSVLEDSPGSDTSPGTPRSVP